MEKAAENDGGVATLVERETLAKELATSDPVEYVRRFQDQHGLRISGSESAVLLLDTLGNHRGDTYRVMMRGLQTSLIATISQLTPEKALLVLESSLAYLNQPILNEVPIKIMEHVKGPLPDRIYARLASMSQESLNAVPIGIKRRMWELHVDVFDKYFDSLVQKYLSIGAIIRSDNMAMIQDGKKRRKETSIIVEASKAIGPSDILLARACTALRRLFVETANSFVCTMLVDLTASVYESRDQAATKASLTILMDDLKLRYGSHEFDSRAESEKFTHLEETIEALCVQVRRERDGDAYQEKPRPPKPPAPPVPRVVMRQSLPQVKKSKKNPSPLLAEAVRSFKELVRTTAPNVFVKFCKPVAVLFKNNPPLLKDYKARIQHPMDLETMVKKANKYMTLDEIMHDIALMRDNAIKFNPDFVEMQNDARELYRIADDHFNSVLPPELLSAPDEDFEAVTDLPVESGFYGTEKDVLNEDENDFEVGSVQRPKPPMTAVSATAAIAVMVFADPNTRHALAKMMWLLLLHRVVRNGVLPRDVRSVSGLLWLMKLGENAIDIVRASFENQPNELLSADGIDPTDYDVILHRALPLCAYLLHEKGRAGPSPKMLDLCKEHSLAAEYLLRFTVMHIQAIKNEDVSINLLKACLPFQSYPGYRRGLAWVLQKISAQPMLEVRKFILEHMFIPQVVALRAQLAPEGDVSELVTAHETLSAILEKDKHLPPELISDYLRTVLRPIPHSFYLSSPFGRARGYYERILARENLTGLRAILNLPDIPGKALREMSPGSTKMSPSPGEYYFGRPQSAGPQTASPQYFSPGV